MLAHFMGHAIGLPHTQAIEGGSKVIDQSRRSVKEYGNVFSLMGTGWPRKTTGEMNLLYKSFSAGLTLTWMCPRSTLLEDTVFMPLIRGKSLSAPWVYDSAPVMKITITGLSIEPQAPTQKIPGKGF